VVENQLKFTRESRRDWEKLGGGVGVVRARCGIAPEPPKGDKLERGCEPHGQR